MKSRRIISKNNFEKRRHSLKYIMKILFWILCIGSIPYTYVYRKYSMLSLVKNSKFTTAIIVDFQSKKISRRGFKLKAHYAYKIDGKCIEGKGNNYEYYEMYDTIIIVYDTTNVENSIPYLDFTEKDLLPLVPDSLKKWL